MTLRGHLPGRRAFLRTLGATALAPFLPILNVSGQEQTQPKRLILFYTPHGTVKKLWTPTGSETAFQLSRILAPLERHKNKIVVLSGINMQDVGVGAPHTKGLPLLWTGSKLLADATFTRADGSGGATYGWNSGPSVDQLVARKIGTSTPYRSLEFGVRCGQQNPASRMIYSDAKQPASPATDPWSQFARLFAAPNMQLTDERLATLGLIRGELTRISTRIASEERGKVEAHLGALANLETRLRGRARACVGPTLLAKKAPGEIDSTPLVMDSQLQLIASALACDLTRVASLQYSIGDNDGNAYPWLGINDEHHTLTHAADSDAASWEKVAKIRVWYSEQFAKLLDYLAAVPEGTGSMLDNCMVVWGSELGTGNTHSFKSTPFVIAGGAAGSYKTGRFLDFAEKVDHNRLLVSICQTFGLADTQTVGNTDLGRGPLPGL